MSRAVLAGGALRLRRRSLSFLGAAIASQTDEVAKRAMRVVILGLCALFAGGVFVAILLSIWSSRRGADRAPDFRQGILAELVWAAIPCLMVIAAAIPAAIAIAAARN